MNTFESIKEPTEDKNSTEYDNTRKIISLYLESIIKSSVNKIKVLQSTIKSSPSHKDLIAKDILSIITEAPDYSFNKRSKNISAINKSNQYNMY